MTFIQRGKIAFFNSMSRVKIKCPTPEPGMEGISGGNHVALCSVYIAKLEVTFPSVWERTETERANDSLCRIYEAAGQLPNQIPLSKVVLQSNKLLRRGLINTQNEGSQSRSGHQAETNSQVAAIPLGFGLKDNRRSSIQQPYGRAKEGLRVLFRWGM